MMTLRAIGASFFFPEGRNLLTTRVAGGVVALCEADFAFYGKRQAMPQPIGAAVIACTADGASRTSRRGKTCHRQVFHPLRGSTTREKRGE